MHKMKLDFLCNIPRLTKCHSRLKLGSPDREAGKKKKKKEEKNNEKE